MKNWFEVDKEGFRALQSGKPKFHAIRELVQNALDEDVSSIIVSTRYSGGTLCVSVQDDGPGFRNLKDAYTLFADTYKRPDATKRGRFNLGEKQAFAVCKSAIVRTTSGTVIFDNTGRHTKRNRTEVGTVVEIVLTKITKQENEEINNFFGLLLIPHGISFVLNNVQLRSTRPINTFETKLKTEHLKDGDFKPTTRITTVELYESTDELTYLYELGIPVCIIDCKYNVNILQRVPMSMDRDKVSETYLQDLFAEILNHSHNTLEPEESSEMWVRMGSKDERVSKQALQTVIKKRYGDKVVVATPSDPISIDDAISEGYDVVHGRTLSGEEWDQIKKHGLIRSSKDLFGKSPSQNTRSVEPDPHMIVVKSLVQKMAQKVFGIHVNVEFVHSDAACRASYGDRTLTFNLRQLTNGFFTNPLNQDVIDLIIHELGHEDGMHTQKEYHQALCRLGSVMTVTALTEPEFFEEFNTGV